jgi:hypothetical protein
MVPHRLFYKAMNFPADGATVEAEILSAEDAENAELEQ